MTRKHQKSGMDRTPRIERAITRRDFIGATLIGAGAGLLTAAAPSVARGQATSSPAASARPPHVALGPKWTGPGGLGDYKLANGNTHEVVNAAHSFARADNATLPADTIDTGEIYDVVIVGGGFSGLSAALTGMWAGKKCLVLDVHTMFGGEGKLNLFEVDGHKLYAPQGSNVFSLPTQAARDFDLVDPYWDKVGLPSEFRFVQPPERIRGRIKIARDNYGPQIHQQQLATHAHFYFDKDGGGLWAMHPWENGFAEAPIEESEKKEIMRFVRDTSYPKGAPQRAWDAWLDTMTYKDLIENVMGYSPRMTAFMDVIVAAGATGCACEHLSAYCAHTFGYPTTLGFYGQDAEDLLVDLEFGTFPGGNTGINRYFVKALIPDAIGGKKECSDVHNGSIDFEALDRPSNQVRIRLDALVVHVKHDGDPERADTLTVAYRKDGKLYGVKGRTVIMCGQGHSNKYACIDLPQEIRRVYQDFVHGPMLTVNLALHNWRFLEKLGASAVRWFGGDMGFWVNVRQPMVMSDGSTMPLDPDLPIVLTHYVPFPTAGVDAKTSATLGRARLFSMSYADIEAWVVRHYTQLFGAYGFDARRDIAGIISNRWGHAYISPGPGFFFDRNGKTSPMNLLKRGYGRVFFGHSETAGRQLWTVATAEGRRAANQALALL